jgi:hypothetical protein
VRQGNEGGSPAARRSARASAPIEAPEDTDWEEIRELVTESYRILAPKKLTALLD